MNAGIVALKAALRKLELNGNGEMLWKPTAPPVPAPHFEDANIITALFQLFRKAQRPYYEILVGSWALHEMVRCLGAKAQLRAVSVWSPPARPSNSDRATTVDFRAK